jgi:hypothetical protein
MRHVNIIVRREHTPTILVSFAPGLVVNGESFGGTRYRHFSDCVLQSENGHRDGDVEENRIRRPRYLVQAPGREGRVSTKIEGTHDASA